MPLGRLPTKPHELGGKQHERGKHTWGGGEGRRNGKRGREAHLGWGVREGETGKEGGKHTWDGGEGRRNLKRGRGASTPAVGVREGETGKEGGAEARDSLPSLIRAT